MLTGLGGKIMEYDGENRPLSVTYLGKKTCYVYGTDGKRLKKVEGLTPTQDCATIPAGAATTVYFGAVEVRKWKVAGAEQVLTYPHPAVKLLNGYTTAAATYLHRDTLGSVRAITSAAGVKLESALYKPFGEQSEWLLPGHSAPETKGWIGERYDADAGLQYLNARYYDPELSLFLQPDWFEVTKPGVGTNRFSYSFNDPVNKLDPGGNEELPDEAVVLELPKGPEDWYSYERLGNTQGWKDANEYNIQQEAGFEEYKTIAQRADFYDWYQDRSIERGDSIQWPGAAADIAHNVAMGTYTAVGDLDQFLNDGNRAIFNDVFGKLTERYNSSPLGPAAAKDWDMRILAEEQNLTQPLYDAAVANGYFHRVEAMATGTGRYFYGGLIADTFDGDLYSVQDRWSYGMAQMGYDTSGASIPTIGTEYSNGSRLWEVLSE